MAEKFEAVVIGAGPAGCAAAFELARNGVEVLVLERGKFPGSKNVTGGILYGQTNTPYNLDYLIPEFEKEAPLERRITKYYMHAIHDGKVKTMDITDLHDYNTKFAYSVLRARFDRWFAQKVHEEARKNGGGVLSEIHVKGPIIENGKIVGIESNELDPIHANLIIAADGATSEMVRKAGLRDWFGEEELFQGVKVVLRMPREDLESTFKLENGDGSAHLFAGNIFEGIRGGGFLYTNKDTLSIGTVFHLDSLAGKNIPPSMLLDRLLTHPLMRSFTPRCEEVEYSAKLIPDGKKCLLRKPHRDSMLVVGDAAGQMREAGPIIKGMNFGITAGVLAAQAYLRAKSEGRLETAGSIYEQLLGQSYVTRELKSWGYRLSSKVLGNSLMNGILEGVVNSGVNRWLLRRKMIMGLVEKTFVSYRLMSMAPDIELVFVTLPSVVAREQGREVTSENVSRVRTLDERIADLKFDTDIGNPHIELIDDGIEANGKCVSTCPVSSPDSSRGCYRMEKIVDETGREVVKVALDTQPCIECGTCAVVGKVMWTHPSGGKGVNWEWG